MRFLKYCLAFLGLFVALSSFGVVVAKLIFPAHVGVWVWPNAGFVIGVPPPVHPKWELLGDSFVPLFTLFGIVMGRLSLVLLSKLGDVPQPQREGARLLSAAL